MPPLQSMPPLQALMPAITALVFLSLHLWAPAVQHDASLPVWRLGLGMLATVAAMTLAVWLAKGRLIRLHDTTLELRQLRSPWHATHLPVDKLRGITTLAGASFGFDVTFLTFEGHQAIPLPAYYTNAEPLLRMLKAKLSMSPAT